MLDTVPVSSAEMEPPGILQTENGVADRSAEAKRSLDYKIHSHHPRARDERLIAYLRTLRPDRQNFIPNWRSYAWSAKTHARAEATRSLRAKQRQKDLVLAPRGQRFRSRDQCARHIGPCHKSDIYSVPLPV
jgi:hypothetical protein